MQYAQLKLSKKGRCKWRFDEQPQKFVIVAVDHEDGISPKRNFHTLNMGDKYALQLVRAGKPRKRKVRGGSGGVGGEDDGEDYLGCQLHTLKTATMMKDNAAKDHRHYRQGSTASSSGGSSSPAGSISSRSSSNNMNSDVLRSNSSMLALESLEASVQNIVVQGRSSRTHHLVCRSLATLPARTLFMYVDLHGSTRELMFALNDPSSKSDDEDDEDDEDDVSSMNSSTSLTTGGRASSVHQATSSSSSSGSRSGSRSGAGVNAADYIEGGPNSAEVTLVLRGVGLSVIDSLRTELLFVTIENLSINVETDNDLNSAEIIANCIQIDNLMPGTEFPVLLQPKYVSAKHAMAGMTGEETKATEAENERKGVSVAETKLPCFNAVLVQRKSEGTINYYPYLMIALQEMNLCVEVNPCFFFFFFFFFFSFFLSLSLAVFLSPTKTKTNKKRCSKVVVPMKPFRVQSSIDHLHSNTYSLFFFLPTLLVVVVVVVAVAVVVVVVVGTTVVSFGCAWHEFVVDGRVRQSLFAA